MKKFFIVGTMTFICIQVMGQVTHPKYLENTVNKIKLRDPDTVEKTLGKGNDYIDKEDNETVIVNRDGNQIFTMIFYPGGTTNEFYAFRVEYNTKALKSNLKIDTKDFVTGKKIKLGLTEKQVKRKLGAPVQISAEDGLTVWRYQTESDLYFGRYDFNNGRLIQFWFGEEYP